MVYNFEEAIGKLLHEQGKTKKSLYDTLKLTRQGFDNKLKNQTVSVLELAQMSTFFGIDEANLMAILANKPRDSKSNLAIGDDYLRKHLNDLEGEFAKLVDQLKIKDNQLEKKDLQIEGLQRMLESVLGKSEGVTDEPLSLFAEVTLDMLGQYKTLVLEQVAGKGPVRKTNKQNSKVGGTPFSHAENTVSIK